MNGTDTPSAPVAHKQGLLDVQRSVVVPVTVVVVGGDIVETIVNTDVNKVASLGEALGRAIAAGLIK